jgi:hypothetical protein
VPITPVFLLAFANDWREDGCYLRNLPAERKAILKALRPSVDKKELDVLDLPNATREEVYDGLLGEQLGDRIRLFHFAGHAGAASLIFETANGEPAPAYAEGLAALLGKRAVGLVFLNGCATRDHTAELLGAGVGSVIVTSEAIDDRIAADFAVRFYQGIAARRSVREAFDDASAAMKGSCSSVRDAYASDRSFMPPAGGWAKWPWRLYAGQEADFGLIGSLASDHTDVRAIRQRLLKARNDKADSIKNLKPKRNDSVRESTKRRAFTRALSVLAMIIVAVILVVLSRSSSLIPCDEVEVIGLEVELSSGKALRREGKSVALSLNDLASTRLRGRALLNPEASSDSCSCEWSVGGLGNGIVKDVTDDSDPCSFIIDPNKERFPLDLRLKLGEAAFHLLTIHRQP